MHFKKSIIIVQQNSAHFEEGIVRAIQSGYQAFDESQSRMSVAVHDTGVHSARICLKSPLTQNGSRSRLARTTSLI